VLLVDPFSNENTVLLPTMVDNFENIVDTVKRPYGVLLPNKNRFAVDKAA